MDLSPRTVGLTGPIDSVKTHYLTLLALCRGLNVHREEASRFAFCHRDITLYGLWPATEYLVDLRVYPNLLPGTPAERGLMRTLTEQVLWGMERPLNEAKRYLRERPERLNQHFLLGKLPQLYDFAFAAAVASEGSTGEFRWFVDLLNRFIDKENEERDGWPTVT